MKHLLLVLLLAFTFTGGAQSTLKFCVEVDAKGKCAKHTNEFDITPQGGTVSLLLESDNGFDAAKIRFKIFFVDASGSEKQINVLEQDIEKTWTYIWKDVVFYDAGMYKVKAYSVTTQESFLCSEILKIFTP